MIIKIIKGLIFLLTLHFALLTLHLRPAGALTMSNDNYILQMGNLNMAAGKPTGDNNKLNFTMGQTAPGLYTGTNYKIRAGFQYIHSLISFAFSIDELDINFGTLTAGEPVTRNNLLTISNGSAHGYTVTATESSQLANPAYGVFIPDTTCDNGTCTQVTAALWTNNLTYGFGYRCDNVSGTDCSTDFDTANFYKQFADITKNEAPTTVMSGANVGRNKKGRVTYKVNISASQAAGTYRNFITYVATPTF